MCFVAIVNHCTGPYGEEQRKEEPVKSIVDTEQSTEPVTMDRTSAPTLGIMQQCATLQRFPCKRKNILAYLSFSHSL